MVNSATGHYYKRFSETLLFFLGESNYTTLTANTDLDTLYGDPGKAVTVYVIPSQGVSSSLVNTPVNMVTGAVLFVITGYATGNVNTRYRTQILIYHTSVYIRYIGNGESWGSWKEVSTI